MPHPPCRRSAALTPVALAVLLATSAPAPAAQRYWTFITGCSTADWFGTTKGPNGEGKFTCWSDSLIGQSGFSPPTSIDDVFILAGAATQPLLVTFADPIREPPPGSPPIEGRANNVFLQGSAGFAAGLKVDRGTLTANTFTLGAQGGNNLGQIDQAAGAVNATIGLTVFSGSYNLNKGSLFAGQLNLRSQTADARFTMNGGTFTAGVINLVSELSGAASFSQLAGDISSSGLSIGGFPGTLASTVTVKSAGTGWVNSGTTTVGGIGSGVLNVLDGAQARTGGAVIGAGGATGSVTVQGSKSLWKVDNTLVVGNGGTAQLVIGPGGRVSAANVSIDSMPSGSQGVLVQGAGALLDVATSLRVGSSFDGSLVISDGGQVNDQFGVVGDTKRTNASVTLSGSGTRWNNGTSLVVGDRTKGEINVSGGARLDSALATVGLSNAVDLGDGSSVTLKDAQTAWNVGGLLTVGQGGLGTVTLKKGATLNSGSAVVGYAVNGAGSVSLDGSSWINAALLTVGQGGAGALAVTSGGSFSGASMLLGDGSGSQGTLTLQDDGSQVNVAGSFTAARTGSATVTLAGARLNAGSASFGELAGGSAAVTFKAGSALSVGGDMTVGGAGSATFDFQGNGSTLQSRTLTLGRDGGGKGTVTLAGAAVSTTGDTVIGNNGSGVLNIGNGGSLNGVNAFIGRGSGGEGQVTLGATRGNDANWVLSGALQVGGPGKGQLELKTGGNLQVAGATTIGPAARLALSGGKLTTGGLALDRSATFEWNAGTLKVTGAGGIALAPGGLPAQLELRAGRTLAVDNTLTVGNGARLSLAGGQLTAGTLALDGGAINGSAALNMNDFGALTGSGRVDVAVSGGSGKQITATGALTLGNADSAGGFAYRGTLNVGGNTVTLADKDGAELGSLTTLSEGGRLVSSSGFKLAFNERLQSSGNAFVQGAFANGGSVFSSGGLLDFQGGLVSGNGSFSGNVGFEAGFNPGNGTGNVAFNGGNVSFGSGSMLTLEINGTGPTRYDRLSGIGALSFAGGLTLAFGPDFSVGSTTRLTVLNFASFSGGFDPQRISITGIDAARVDLSRLASSGQLVIAPGAAFDATSVSAVPEPGTGLLWLAGLGVMLARCRRYASKAGSKR